MRREHYRWWTVYPFTFTRGVRSGLSLGWRLVNPFTLGVGLGLKLGPVTGWVGRDGVGVSCLGRYGWEWSRTLGRRAWRLHA